MENQKPKHELYDHPYQGGLIALIIAVLVIPNLGHFPDFVLGSIQDLHPEIAVSAEVAALVNNGSCVLTIVFAFAALLIHRLWFRKDGYKGCFTRPGFRNKAVWLAVLCGLLLDLAVSFVNAATSAAEGSKLLLPSLTTVLLSLEAGIYEETSYRAIPVSIMMKNGPDYRRMWTAVLLTSVMFGLIHMVNMTAGAGLAASIMQTVFALCIGLLLGAIYMRTGNILLTMVYHALHDVISMMDPFQATGIIKQTSYSFFDLALTAFECLLFIAAALFLLRKSKWAEIKATWANVWSE